MQDSADDRLGHALAKGRWLLVLGAVLAITGALAVFHFRAEEGPTVLRLGAGHPEDEGFHVAAALADAAEGHEAGIRIEVVPTSGSAENARLLAAGELELATTQADLELPPEARLVSVLYPDTFLVLVPSDAPMRDVSDLAGRRIAAPEAGSGQADSLDHLLAHYDLIDKVTLVRGDEATGEAQLAEGSVDALFRVRSLQNEGLHALADRLSLRVLLVGQAAALQAANPALTAGEVPTGALRGRPALPDQPVPTVVVDRLLVAHTDVPADAVEAVARTLFERRQALVRHAPVSAGVRTPERDAALVAPMHDGLLAWFHRDEPGFIEKNVDMISLLMSVGLLLWSWVWAGRAWMEKRMQTRSDQHNFVLVALLNEAHAARTAQEVGDVRARLIQRLEVVMDDLEEERITGAQFQGAAVAWQAAHGVLQDRERMLGGQATHNS